MIDPRSGPLEVVVAEAARRDLHAQRRWYEARKAGLGEHFLNTVWSELEGLQFYAGIHLMVMPGVHRCLMPHFPFAIYYQRDERKVRVIAVLHMRRQIDGELMDRDSPSP